MKEQKQDVGATAFDLSNNQHPGYPNNIYYGNQYVPHPTNAKAKLSSPEKIMSQVNKAK